MLNAIEQSRGASSWFGACDPDPVMLLPPRTRLDMVFCCDHAGNRVPEKLGMLGLEPAELNRHIGLDIGIFSTTNWLAHFLGAPFVAQAYSRLVIDCNRRPGTSQSIPACSDAVLIPANQSPGQQEQNFREEHVFRPYHQAVQRVIQECAQNSGVPPALIAMHSFTRELKGKKRLWDIGVIYDDTSEIGEHVLHLLQGYDELNIGCNVPYQIDFTNDYTIPEHAVQNSLPYVEIEICQDLIVTCAGQRKLADLLVPVLVQAVSV